MIALSPPYPRRCLAAWQWLRRVRKPATLVSLLVLFPALALAQRGSPFDIGFTALQNLFTGTIASLIAIVIGGYEFEHGEPGAKKTLAGVAARTASEYFSRRRLDREEFDRNLAEHLAAARAYRARILGAEFPAPDNTRQNPFDFAHAS